MVIDITIKDTDEKKESRNQHVDEDGLSLLITLRYYLYGKQLFFITFQVQQSKQATRQNN